MGTRNGLHKPPCIISSSLVRLIPMKTVGDRVRERRLALKLSQPQLAKKAGGITYQAIQQLEAGGGTKHLVAIARALGVSAEWLQDGTGPAPSGKIVPSRASLAEKLKVLGMAE